MIGLAVVVSLAILVLTAPAPQPVSLRFLGSTNHEGMKTLLFEGKSGVPRKMTYWAAVYGGSVYAAQLGLRVDDYYAPATGEVEPGGTFSFSLTAPPEGTNWCVEWALYERDRTPTHFGRARASCYRFLMYHGMPKLARPFRSPNAGQYIAACALKE